jgi:hypothetical protein
VATIASPGAAQEFKFRIQEFETQLGVGYAVTLVDMNEDRKTDIVVVDQERVIWYESPSWKRHTLIQNQTKPDNVCIAPYDIDGDGKLDFALGADWRPFDTRNSGTIQWLSRGKSADGLWSVHSIGTEPTVHRMRWADLDGDGRDELIVVPLMGRGTTRPHFAEAPLRILAYKIPKDPARGPWEPEVISQELHVAHNFEPTDFDGDGRTDLLVASFEGVTLLTRSQAGKWTHTRLGTGNQETSPNRGASEIKRGKLTDGSSYIATIEPWHGFQVVAYTPPTAAARANADGSDSANPLWTRTVLDERLQWGHAVWCANLDEDADEELIIGVRDDYKKGDDHVPSGLRIYDPHSSGGQVEWKSQYIDLGGVAIEDLAAADLDADGRIDIVAVGRKTKNGRIYWNQGK